MALREATEATPAKRGSYIAWAVLTGVLYWLLTHFLYSWFVQYLDVAYKIQEAKLIASISSYVIPALLSSAIIWGVYQLGRRKPRVSAISELETAESRGDSAQSVSDQLPLNHAIYFIARRSAWGREFAAQYLVQDNCTPTSERNIMQNATHLLTEAAMKGRIEIKGRKVGETKFALIHPDTWKLICLDVQPNNQTLCRVSIKYKSRLTKEQKNRVPQYDSLSISESALRREWPEKDRKSDAYSKKLLQKAKCFGANQQEIDKLWPQ